MKNLIFACIFSTIFPFLGFSQTTLYDVNTIQDIYLTISQANWDYQLDTAKAGAQGYMVIDGCTINGISYDSVGIKYKGNSSYSPNNAKNPLHINLDYVRLTQNYQGVTDLKLSNGKADPSFVRETLSYELLANYMHVPRANYARVYVNNVYYGLMTNIESINKAFLSEKFYSKDGTFIKCNPKSVTSGQSSSLVYLGTDTTLMYNRYELQSTFGWHDLRDLTDTLTNSVANIERILDVDRALWMLAFNDVFVNMDSYTGSFTQNYYLYRDAERKFNPIAWDLNMSFGSFNQLGNGSGNPTAALDTNTVQTLIPLLHSTNGARPLIKQLLANATYKRMYMAHLRTMSNECFGNTAYFTRAQQMQTLIDAAVQADANKFYTYANFTKNLKYGVATTGGGSGTAIAGIRDLVQGRYTYLSTNADFIKIAPSIATPIPTTTAPLLNSSVTITAQVTGAGVTQVLLGYRKDHTKHFTKTTMYDNGTNGDVTAADGIYSTQLTMDAAAIEYYIYAENVDAGQFSPARAEHEFHTLTANLILPQGGEVVINEIMANNTSTQADQNGEFDDWIELHNNTAAPVNLTGVYLTDNPSNHKKWTFPVNTSIAANSYLIVWADEQGAQTGLHANFKLSGTGGEHLILSNGSTTLIDSVAFGAQQNDISFGRYANGTGNFINLSPTFNAENTIVSVENTDLPAANFSTFPNPTHDVLAIKSSIAFENIHIYNVLGQNVYAIRLTQKENVTTFALPELAQGIYYIKIDGLAPKAFFVK
jgi:spore coat protein CotH